jgi:hypothetical protein
MHTELETRWEKLQHSKRIMEELIVSSGNDAHFQPNQGWSISQVIEHLLASESGTFGYMKKKSSGGWDTLEEAEEEHHAKSAALIARLESDERYKAPDVLPEPSNNFSIEELVHKWNDLREDLHAFLQTIDKAHFHKLVFRQPAAGMLTVLHALEFMDAHLLHHLPQIERIGKS